MANKKKKSVLDYDPLAWLSEESDMGEKKSKTKAKSKPKSKPKSKVKAKAKAKAKVKAKAIAKPKTKVKTKVEAKIKSETKSKAKSKPKSKTKPKAKTKSNAKTNKKINGEVSVTESKKDQIKSESTFEQDSKLTIQPSDVPADEGFGFFDETPTQTALPEESDEGFGFFSDELSSKNIEEIEDEGFGFFDQSEVLEIVDSKQIEGEVLDLGSELSIKTVAEIKQQIDQMVAADIDVVINAEELIKIDTAGLQLLFSLRESLAKTGHHIKWAGTSSVINDSAELIGMPVLAPKSKDANFGFFEDKPKDAEDGSSGFF